MSRAPIVLVSTVAIASMIAVQGCGSSGSGGKAGGQGGGGKSGTSSSGGSKGGSPSSSGSASTTAPLTNCPDGTPGGGDLSGTWDVTSSSLEVTGDMDGSPASLGCPTVPIKGSLEVTGTWIATGNGKYTDNTTTKSSVTFPLDDSCLSVSKAPVLCSKMGGAFTPLGWTTCECSTNASGKCTCSATATQAGGIGVVSPWASDSGTYKASGSGLKVDNDVDYSYCASGNRLTLIPTPTFLPIKGTIVLQKNVTGSGGTGGGGASGSGGKTDSGGSTSGSGGSTSGSGGKTGSGGSTSGSGGKTGSGGSSSGSGGAAAGSGGKTGSGGSTSGSAGATAGSGGTSGTGGTSATGSRGTAPCDIYAAASNKCVAAHSTVRALFASYTGKLYQVRRASDKKTQDIGVGEGGMADSNSQDTFCTGTTCVVTRVYDQSGNGNFVSEETTEAEYTEAKPKPGSDGEKNMTAANAAKERLSVGGFKVYSLYLTPKQAYWRDGSKSGMPLGNSPQGVYMVTSGKHYGSGCCFDYGNGPLSRTVSGCGTMDAVNFSSNTMWGTGAGAGPWVMFDPECGLKAQSDGNKNNNSPSMPYPYVTAIEKNNGTSEFALRGADATTGNLSTFYKGKLPYAMKKEGSIILGSGGDCCYSNWTMSEGTFYEGAIVAGYPSDATDDAIQANIVNAGYGK
jgi:hypothetical protein